MKTMRRVQVHPTPTKGSQSGLVPPKSGLIPPSSRSSRAPSPSLSNQSVAKGIPSFSSKRPSSLAGSTQSLPQAVKSIQKPSTGIPRAPSTQQVNQIPKEIPKPLQKKNEPVKQLKAPTSLGVQKPQIAQVTKLEPTPPIRNSSSLPSRKPVPNKIVPPASSPANSTTNSQPEPANPSPLRPQTETLNAANTSGLPLSGLRPPSGHFGRPRPSRPSSVISNSSDQASSRRNSRLLQLSTPPLVPESAPPLPPKEAELSLPPPRPKERREERSELLSEELPPAGLNDISPDDCCSSPIADDSGISYETSPKQSPDLQQRLSDSSLDTSRESHLSEENPTVVEVVDGEDEAQPIDDADVDVTVEQEHEHENHKVLTEDKFKVREPLLEIKSLTLPKPTAAVKGTQQLPFNLSADVEVQERNTLPRCGSTMHKVAMVSPMVNNHNSQSNQKHSLEELKAEHRKEEEEEMDSISPMQPLQPRNAPYGSYLRTNQGSSRFIPGGKYHVPSLRLQADPSRVAFARHLMAASQDMVRLKYPHVQEQEQGGYMSDGDVLRPVRGGALGLEEIPSGYLSEGGASLYRRRQDVSHPSPAPPPNAKHPQGVNSPHKKMNPKLINVLCDDSLKIPPVNTTVLRHPRLKAEGALETKVTVPVRIMDRRAFTIAPRRISIYAGPQERLYHHKRRLLSRSAGTVSDILSRSLDDSSSVSSGLSDTFNEISANDGLTDSSLSSDPYGVLKRHGVHSLQAAHSGSRNVQQTLVKKTKEVPASSGSDLRDSKKDSNKDKDANAKKDKLKKKEAKAKSKMMIMIRNGVSSNDVKLYGTVDPPEAILEAAKHETAMNQMEQSTAMTASLKSRPDSVASVASLNSTKSAPVKPPVDADWSPYKRRVSGPEDGYATLEGIQKAYLHQQEMHWQMPLGPAHPSIHPPRSNKSLLHEAESMESLLSAHSQQQAQSQGSSRFLYGSPGLNHVTPPRGMRFAREDEAGLGSTLSLVSTTSSMYSTPEEKKAHEIRRLRKELDHSNDKVVTLTAQLTTNDVEAFPRGGTHRENNLISTTFLFGVLHQKPVEGFTGDTRLKVDK
ncbi:uncharacterized protein LOC100897622 [Galendromus occidentalis]|uniref:Uncharacterized protein LOC100897622 n=1 Tax=Galendromus occidentalis TaxID=34638 RepID=A0AAJ6QQK8_9ACAR|nr:uncharacterized protein LOC100897622 [Galendromus occidentalis]